MKQSLWCGYLLMVVELLMLLAFTNMLVMLFAESRCLRNGSMAPYNASTVAFDCSRLVRVHVSGDM